MADRLAAQRVSRLDAERVQRPEVLSAMRNNGRQPNQPARATPRRISAAPNPVNSRSPEKTSSIHAVTISGATQDRGRQHDRGDPGELSFVRLISASRLPAIARSDFCFGLEASSSASPSRGSRIGRTGSGSRRSSPNSPLEGRRRALAWRWQQNFPEGSRIPYMARVRTVASPSPIHLRFKRASTIGAFGGRI